MNKENNFDLVKFIDGKFELEVAVSPNGDTVWLSLDEMAILFERDRSVIGKHVRKIYNQNELDENKTRAKNARHLQDGRIFKIDVYNLDVIIAVGYRVNSKRGTIFLQWSTRVLNGYLLKGFAVNEKRTVVTDENFYNFLLIVNNMQANQVNFENRLNVLEDKVLDKEYDKEYEFNKLFFNGQFYDAYTLIQSFFESANNEIIIIDNYVDPVF